MTGWNFNLTDIPRGRTETRTRVVAGKNGEPDKTVEYDVFVTQDIWALTPGWDVVQTHFIPAKSKVDPARWSNMNSQHEPLAWQPLPKPAAPPRPGDQTPQQGAYVPIIEDAGGGV